ncbi:MAG: alpha/beta fold hydrolase [Desulfobacterales bacterium]|nr:alpha/beta fold hydrolase [Desulfobacterales bacterium]
MNRFAYRTARLAFKALSNLSKMHIHIHGEENIPRTPIIYVINHFTRIETLFLPYFINQLTKSDIWSLADFSLFKGALGSFLDRVGALSTQDPHRDLLIVKSLLTGEASWIIYPEGMMVKSKKLVDMGRFIVGSGRGKHPPHTGAAALALRTEFYRRRLKILSRDHPAEAARLLDLFQIKTVESISEESTHIVPVNVTYYPVRARENILSEMAAVLLKGASGRMQEELMVEGTMLLSGVDIDVRFGKPVVIEPFLKNKAIARDIGDRRKIDFDDPIPSLGAMRNAATRIMQQYMSGIYGMTTVNHDHLFAALFHLMPFKSIDADDLKRRAFLAVTGGIEKTGVFFHDSFNVNQIHLIADDRYKKFADFLTIIPKKSVVRDKERVVLKKKSVFSRPLDFHRVRIEDPVSVIANEAEPLQGLQRYLRRISLLPKYFVKRRTVDYLITLGLEDFDKDYKAYYVKGESKSRKVGRPYLVKGKTKKIGVVLVHGYMAAPLEVKALAEHLGRRGIWVYALRLKGHGTAPEDLATRTYADWVTSVDEGYGIISNICEKVVAGGFSTGAGLALDLAARVEGIAGVFAVSPPMQLKDLGAKFAPAVDAWNKFMSKVHMNSVKMEFVDNHPENPEVNYLRNPVAGVHQLENLMESLAPKLPLIKIPALILQSTKDPVVAEKGSRALFNSLGSIDKKYLLFNLKRHGILQGKGAGRVHQAIGDFIEQLC